MEYIKVGKDEKPYNLGRTAIAEAELISGQNLLIKPDFNQRLINALLYVGLKHGARREGTQFKMTQDEVSDLIDDHESLTLDVIKQWWRQVMRTEFNPEAKPEPEGEQDLKS